MMPRNESFGIFVLFFFFFLFVHAAANPLTTMHRIISPGRHFQSFFLAKQRKWKRTEVSGREKRKAVLQSPEHNQTKTLSEARIVLRPPDCVLPPEVNPLIQEPFWAANGWVERETVISTILSISPNSHKGTSRLLPPSHRTSCHVVFLGRLHVHCPGRYHDDVISYLRKKCRVYLLMSWTTDRNISLPTEICEIIFVKSPEFLVWYNFRHLYCKLAKTWVSKTLWPWAIKGSLVHFKDVCFLAEDSCRPLLSKLLIGRCFRKG